jgi:propanol-preferring alcohol dehydrogenase
MRSRPLPIAATAYICRLTTRTQRRHRCSVPVSSASAHWRWPATPARIGIYGFGAAAHIVAQVARHQGRTIYAFTRPGDTAAQQLALRSGARWAGSSDEAPPEELDAALIFAPVGALVPIALKALVKGGIVVCGGIHMSEIPAFSYDLLWEERRICSVANLTREDGAAFMRLAGEFKLEIQVTRYPMKDANRALSDLREGRLTGAAVLVTQNESHNWH